MEVYALFERTESGESYALYDYIGTQHRVFNLFAQPLEIMRTSWSNADRLYEIFIEGNKENVDYYEQYLKMIKYKRNHKSKCQRCINDFRCKYFNECSLYSEMKDELKAYGIMRDYDFIQKADKKRFLKFSIGNCRMPIIFYSRLRYPVWFGFESIFTIDYNYMIQQFSEQIIIDGKPVSKYYLGMIDVETASFDVILDCAIEEVVYEELLNKK